MTKEPWAIRASLALTITSVMALLVVSVAKLQLAPGVLLDALTTVGATWFVEHAGYWLPLTAAPIYLTYRTYTVYRGRIEDERRHVQQTSDLHLATIEALARAIDAKDQTAQMHIRRVQLYAAGLARIGGLSQSEIEGIKTAALLHDIGKLAVPEHILSKPGPLTHEEFQKIRIHPQVGAEIIAAVPFPYPVAPIIMSHHERWDGTGYPQGLAGDAIPIGARILAIVDYYDAITTERPYHTALPHETAIEFLRHEAGRALDPALVPLFVDSLPSFRAQIGSASADLQQTVPGDASGTPLDAVLAPSSSTSAFENIALAHREIYALYEIAQSMGTSLGVAETMALISSKISKIVPWSGCALFLHQPDGDGLRCRFAAGVDAPKLLDAHLKADDGPSEAAARPRRADLSSDPRVMFDAAGIADAIGLRSAIVCPLYSNGGVIGTLALYHVEENRYTEDHRRLVERIAEQAGAVIHNSIVFEQTQEDSLTDPLTGLPNRRSMFAHLSRELSRADRLAAEMALVVMDLDGFKAINDTYGHSVGDHALRQVAQSLQSALRPYDLCVRYAGDEFIVVLSDCSREMAEAKRSELQQRIAAIRFEVRPGRRLLLGASAGASVFPHDGTTYEALLAGADHRMYRDKVSRRGEVTIPHRSQGAPPVPSEEFGAA